MLSVNQSQKPSIPEAPKPSFKAQRNEITNYNNNSAIDIYDTE